MRALIEVGAAKVRGDVIIARDTEVEPSDRWACWDKREKLGHKGLI